MNITLIISFGRLICFAFQASSTLAPEQRGGECQLAMCTPPLWPLAFLPRLRARSPLVLQSPQRWPGAPKGALLGVHGCQEPIRCWMLVQEQQFCGLWWASAGFPQGVLHHRCLLLLPIIPSSGSSARSSRLHQRDAGQCHSVPSPVALAASWIHHLGRQRPTSANSERQHLSPALKPEFLRQHWGTRGVFRSSRTHGNKGFSWMQWSTAPLQG